MHTETERAWLAGFIDGEGNIGITHIASTGPLGKRHVLRVTVTNTHVPTLHHIHELWGATRMSMRERKNGWKAAGDVVWWAQRAGEVLREVQPYLVTKKEQCRIALEFLETMNSPEHRSRPITDEIWNRREALRLELSGHNRKATAEAVESSVETKPPLTCQYCKKEFTSYQKRRKYCSRDCNLMAGREAYVDRHTYQKVCPSCGQEFTARLKQLYCSNRCGRKGSGHAPVPKGSKRDPITRKVIRET